MNAPSLVHVHVGVPVLLTAQGRRSRRADCRWPRRRAAGLDEMALRQLRLATDQIHRGGIPHAAAMIGSRRVRQRAAVTKRTRPIAHGKRTYRGQKCGLSHVCERPSCRPSSTRQRSHSARQEYGEPACSPYSPIVVQSACDPGQRGDQDRRVASRRLPITCLRRAAVNHDALAGQSDRGRIGEHHQRLEILGDTEPTGERDAGQVGAELVVRQAGERIDRQLELDRRCRRAGRGCRYMSPFAATCGISADGWVTRADPKPKLD